MQVHEAPQASRTCVEPSEQLVLVTNASDDPIVLVRGRATEARNSLGMLTPLGCLAIESPPAYPHGRFRVENLTALCSFK